MLSRRLGAPAFVAGAVLALGSGTAALGTRATALAIACSSVSGESER